MKIIDEKGKLFGLINVVDLFVLIVIIALVGFGAAKMLKVNPTVATATKKVTFNLLIGSIKQTNVDQVNVGDIAKDYDKSTTLGKIVNKTVTKALDSVTTADGKIIKAEVPDKFDMVLVIEGNATVGNDMITMGSEEIRIGKTLGLKGLKFGFRGTIQDINIKE